jgi:hypothetical protein
MYLTWNKNNRDYQRFFSFSRVTLMCDIIWYVIFETCDEERRDTFQTIWFESKYLMSAENKGKLN